MIARSAVNLLPNATAAGDESHTEQGDLADDHVSRRRRQ
jgi:hypothetical protein